MSAALLAGLLAGYGVALPVGAVGALLVSLTARTSLRIGAAAALGVATADGLYALAAVLGGSGAARLLQPSATPLRWAGATVLAVLAARTALTAVRAHRDHRARRGRPGPDAAPGASSGRTAASASRAYATLLGLTLLNPATVVYFAALVLGDRIGHGGSASGPASGAAFAAAAFAASASWQLLLASGGAALGRVLAGPGGRLATALASSLLVAGLAVRLLLSG